jgi:hypothetical protein
MNPRWQEPINLPPSTGAKGSVDVIPQAKVISETFSVIGRGSV